MCGKMWHGALGAKGCHPDQRFCRWKLLFYQQPCAKAKEFGEAEFWDSMPVFYGGILYWLLEKQGKLYFLQSSQTKGRGVLLRLVTPVLSAAVCKSSRIRHSPNSGTVRRFPVLPTPCAKTREFGEAEFSDCLPVSALVCVFAFDTGGLGLWLGAFGRSRLYRCQSVPGPPMPCFVTQSLGFAAFKKAGKFYFLQSSQTKGRDVLASKKPSLVQLPCAKTREFGLRRILGIVMPVFCGTELCLWHRAFVCDTELCL